MLERLSGRSGFLAPTNRYTRLPLFRNPDREITRWQYCELRTTSHGSAILEWCGMLLREYIGRVLAIFVIASLVTGPLPYSARAKTLSSSVQIASMPADMSCCPDEPAAQPCPECPLFALCMLKGALGQPISADAAPFKVSIKTRRVLQDEIAMDGLNRPPPDHPPRNLI